MLRAGLTGAEALLGRFLPDLGPRFICGPLFGGSNYGFPIRGSERERAR